MSSEDGGTDEVVNWTILKSIQEANAASMRAMEEYLLLVSHPDAVGSPERTHELLERSIDRHEWAIEHLAMAARRIEADLSVDSERSRSSGPERSRFPDR